MNPFARFLVAVGMVCTIGYAGLHLVARTPAFCAHASDYAATAPCYQYDVAGRRADVLLVGDSALLYGIRPATVRAASGLSAWNFGLVGPAFAFDPAAVIDHWLAHNARPRMIVAYVSPWDRIEPGRITDPQWAPLAVLTARHGGLAAFARLVAARPAALVEIPPLVLASVGRDTSAPARRRAAMLADDGHLDHAVAVGHALPPLDAGCRPPATPEPVTVSDRERAALAALRARYRVIGIPFYLYVAPTAPCDGAIAAIRRSYAGVADNVPAMLPDRLFANDTPRPLHVHLEAEGAEAASHLLARFVGDRAHAGFAR